MINLRDHEVYIFDCDGVILNSNTLKTSAFEFALKDEDPKLVNRLIEFHKKNGGISRYEKFNYFFSEICPSKDKDLKIKIALDAFSKKVSKEMLQVETITGVISFLERIKELNKDIYINSGSDEEELRKIFRHRKLDHLFKEIYGSPSNKEENLRKIRQNYRSKKKEVFFGDSVSDFEAAESFKIDFVFISTASEWKEVNKNIENKFVDFDEAFEALV
tara:strand:+ start:51 stop:704 length:654 start_codon:yes stop_codon:yes gene_type:complete